MATAKKKSVKAKTKKIQPAVKAKKKAAPAKSAKKPKVAAKNKPASKVKAAPSKSKKESRPVAPAKAVKFKPMSAKVSSKSTTTSLKAWENLFTPLEDRIIVQIAAISEKTAGGLYIPGSVSEQPQQGLVLSVGRGRKDKKGRLRPMDVKTGETVLFGPYSGSKMNVGVEEVLILREEEVLGVLIS